MAAIAARRPTTPPSPEGASAPSPAARRARQTSEAALARAARTGDTRLRPTLRRPAAVLGPRALRSIDKILVATKEIFLSKGYGGTSIDEIAQRAGVSRASFYTYFPSKRDALLTLGATASTAANAIIDRLVPAGPAWTVADCERWVAEYFEFLEDHGAFALAWTQAAQVDDELRRAGMKRHLALCRRFGEALGTVRGEAFAAPTETGLLMFSMLDRAWSFMALYRPTIDERAIVSGATAALMAIVRSADGPPGLGRPEGRSGRPDRRDGRTDPAGR